VKPARGTRERGEADARDLARAPAAPRRPRSRRALDSCARRARRRLVRLGIGTSFHIAPLAQGPLVGPASRRVEVAAASSHSRHRTPRGTRLRPSRERGRAARVGLRRRLQHPLLRGRWASPLHDAARMRGPRLRRVRAPLVAALRPDPGRPAAAPAREPRAAPDRERRRGPRRGHRRPAARAGGAARGGRARAAARAGGAAGAGGAPARGRTEPGARRLAPCHHQARAVLPRPLRLPRRRARNGTTAGATPGRRRPGPRANPSKTPPSPGSPRVDAFDASVCRTIP